MLGPMPVHSLATVTKPETTAMDTAGGQSHRVENTCTQTVASVVLIHYISVHILKSTVL